MRGLIIVNSCHRRRVSTELIEKFARHDDLALRYTDFPHHAKYLAREAADHGFDIVIAAGGDGTVNEVINGLAGSQTALAVLPTGTANDFAGQLGITASHLTKPRWLQYARQSSIDLIRVNGWCFSTVGGLGLPCEVLQQMEHLRWSKSLLGSIGRKLHRYAYVGALASLAGSITKRRGPVRIETCGDSYSCDPISLLVANQPVLGHSFRVAPRAVNTDGLCDLFVINYAANSLKSLWAVGRTMHSLGSEPDNVLRLQTSHLRLVSSEPTSFFGDGELALFGRLFDIQVIPKALKVLVPAEPQPVTSFARRYPAIHRRVPAVVTADAVTCHRTTS